MFMQTHFVQLKCTNTLILFHFSLSAFIIICNHYTSSKKCSFAFFFPIQNRHVWAFLVFNITNQHVKLQPFYETHDIIFDASCVLRPKSVLQPRHLFYCWERNQQNPLQCLWMSLNCTQLSVVFKPHQNVACCTHFKHLSIV